MSDHRSKLSRKKVEAITALLAQPTVADAAREAGIEHQTLLRWLNHDAEFDAAYRAAKRAEFRHSMVRLGQGATAAVKSIVHIMYHGKTPAMRLTAARAVIRLAAEANEMEDLVAAVVEAQRLIHAARTGGLPKVKRGRAPITGHGAKFPRKKDKAIAALLVHRTVAEAAAETGIGTQALYRWMGDPAFVAEYAAAAGAVFGPAMALAQQRTDDAVVVIRNLSTDRAIPEGTRLKAAFYIAGILKANLTEELVSRASEMERADASAGTSEETSQAAGRNLHQRLERIKACWQAVKPSGIGKIVLAQAVDGKPAGSSVVGSDGRPWCEPPKGSKKGEPAEEQEGRVEDAAA